MVIQPSTAGMSARGSGTMSHKGTPPHQGAPPSAKPMPLEVLAAGTLRRAPHEFAHRGGCGRRVALIQWRARVILEERPLFPVPAKGKKKPAVADRVRQERPSLGRFVFQGVVQHGRIWL